MGRWSAVANGTVREEQLRAMLEAEGTTWEDACHVTATTSLAQAIRSAGPAALPIATLIDLIVLPGLAGEMALPLDDYPRPSFLRDNGLRAYGNAVDAWQRQATGRRIRSGIRFDDRLRAFVRTGRGGDPSGQVLVRARRDFARTVQSLIAAGVRPDDLEPTDALGRLAVAAWRQLEADLPEMTAVREDLWVDWGDFEDQSTEHVKDLIHRIEDSLQVAFGSASGRVIVHHGFYFFTPPQWALFQLLRRLPNVDQIFIVHDDGRSKAFETWRRYFNEKWLMPKPEPARVGGGETLPAAALRDALRGERIDSESLAAGLRVLECRSPAELVREWRHEAFPTREGGDAPQRYAADAKAVDRFVRRLGKEAGSGAVDLAQLPIGSFLLAVHDCIKALPGGGFTIHLTGEGLVDIAASGYLDVRGLAGPTSAFVPAMRRALPFFAGCVHGEDWVERAKVLLRLIVDEVAPLGARTKEASDLERIQIAAAHPLRLAPWADLSVQEAEVVAAIVEGTVALVREIAGRERVLLSDHMKFVRDRLQRGMSQLPDEERSEITAKVNGFSVGLEDEIDVEGLVDVVSMLLGRTADFDVTGEEQLTGGAIAELRSLDALGLRRLRRSAHVANLADGTFPSRVSAIGWPFRPEDLRGPSASVEPVVVEVLEARAENAALSDLYLLWLALDGVEPGHTLTLSWISDVGGEPRNPSSLLSLLTVPRGVADSVKLRAGGLAVEAITPVGRQASLSQRPDAAPTRADTSAVADAALRLDPSAAAASIACSRRFALQWALGPSAAYQSEHHQAMLYGNAVGALMKLRGFGLLDAFRASNDLWRHLTAGQRASSLAKAPVKTSGPSARPLWILTLAGVLKGRGPMDQAYRAASEGAPPEPELIAPLTSGFLPVGVNDPKVCMHCPVRARCLSWDRHD